MKKLFVMALFLPLFAGAQESYQSSANYNEMSWKRVKCGQHSDHKCQGLHVHQYCDKDPSHGYQGFCRDIDYDRNGAAICDCR